MISNSTVPSQQLNSLPQQGISPEEGATGQAVPKHIPSPIKGGAVAGMNSLTNKKITTLNPIEEILTPARDQINSEKDTLLQLAKDLSLSSKNQAESEAFRELGKMFDSALRFETPEKAPDFRVIRQSLGIEGNGWHGGGLTTSTNSTEKEIIQKKIQLSTLIVEYTLHLQLYTPVDSSVGLVFRKWFRGSHCHRILEVGAGAGHWAQALSHQGNPKKNLAAISVTATDINPLHNSVPEVITKPDDQKETVLIKGACKKAHPVIKMDAESAIERYHADHDCLLITSPYRSMVATLQFWPKHKPTIFVSATSFVKLTKELGFIVTVEKLDSAINRLSITQPAYEASLSMEVFKIKEWK